MLVAIEAVRNDELCCKENLEFLGQPVKIESMEGLVMVQILDQSCTLLKLKSKNYPVLLLKLPKLGMARLGKK